MMLKSCAFSRFLTCFQDFKYISGKNASFLGCFQPRIAFLSQRNMRTTPITRLKEIRETVIGNRLVVEGVVVESDKTERLVDLGDGLPNACPLCRLNLDLEHTDVLILSQFVVADGNMLSRRVTGLCEKQQKLVSALVDQAKKAGLMPNHVPAWFSKSRISKKFAWRKFNRYFVPELSGNKTKKYR